MSRGPGRTAAGDVVAVLGGLLLVGAVSGVVWWLLVDPAEYTAAPGGAGSMGELELAGRFAADGWYAVVALVVGFLSGVGLTWWRSRDLRVTTLLLVPGAALAAAAMAFVGGLLGPQDSEELLAGAARGDTVPVELAVSAFPAYLMWPIGVLAGALMVLWSSPGVPSPNAADDVPTQERDPDGRPDPQRSQR